MVETSESNSEPSRLEPGERITYTGGVLWRRMTHASMPLAKLTIDTTGLTIEPNWERFLTARFMWRLFRLPSFSVPGLRSTA